MKWNFFHISLVLMIILWFHYKEVTLHIYRNFRKQDDIHLNLSTLTAPVNNLVIYFHNWKYFDEKKALLFKSVYFLYNYKVETGFGYFWPQLSINTQYPCES